MWTTGGCEIPLIHCFRASRSLVGVQGNQRQLKLKLAGILNAVGLLNAGLFLVFLRLLFSRNELLSVVSFALLAVLAVLHLLFLCFSAKKTSDWLTPLACTFAWFAIALLLGNALVGKWYAHKRAYWNTHRPDKLLGWYPIANLSNHPFDYIYPTFYPASTDAFGHRNSLPYPQDNFLPIIVQGDSNLFGFGLRDDEALCARLNEHADIPNAYNVGVSGFDVNQFYFQYERFAERYRIGKRIIFFNTANDFTLTAFASVSNIRRPYLTVRDGEVVELRDNINPLPLAGYGSHFIEKYASFDHMVTYPEGDWASVWPGWMIRRPLWQLFAERIYRRLMRKLGSPPQVASNAPAWLLLKQEKWLEPWKSYTADFKKILGRLKAQHDDLLIVLFPMRMQIVPADLDKTNKALLAEGYAEDDIQADSFAIYLRGACRDLDIEFLDLTDNFAKAPQPDSLFIPGDDHLSAKGTALCAEHIYRYLQNDTN